MKTVTLAKYSVFSLENNKDYKERTCFFDSSLNISRFDIVKYPQFEKLTDQQLGFFWRPEEIELYRDSKDFKTLSPHEQHIFSSNLKRQILLDSVQSRSPSLAFLPIISLPELETWVQTWAFFETIHSRSYTHIIRNVYSNPSIIFDDIINIPEIVDCANDVSRDYDILLKYNNEYSTGNNFDLYQHKKILWLCLNSINILEGIRFYISFACSFAFAELKKMEGNAKIIKLIARDENVHLAFTQQLLKILPQEDSDFAKIKEDTKEECSSLFEKTVEQEKKWAEYLFKDGSIIGLNKELIWQYIEWLAHKRMSAIGLSSYYSIKQNPLPWTQKWLSGAEVQNAPQEVQISSYVVGGTHNDLSETSFDGFEL